MDVLVMILFFGGAEKLLFAELMNFAKFTVLVLLRISLALVNNDVLFGRCYFDCVVSVLIEAKRTLSFRCGFLLIP